MNRLQNHADIASTFNDCEEYLSWGNNKAAELYERGSCSDQVWARLSSLAQTIVSIVIVPIALIAMFFAGALGAIVFSVKDGSIQDGLDAGRLFMGGCGAMAATHLYRIPESIIGAIFPCILSRPLQLNPQNIGQALQGLGQMFQGLLNPNVGGGQGFGQGNPNVGGAQGFGVGNPNIYGFQGLGGGNPNGGRFPGGRGFFGDIFPG